MVEESGPLKIQVSAIEVRPTEHQVIEGGRESDY